MLTEWVSVLLIVSGIVGVVFEVGGGLTGLLSVSRTSAGTTISLPSPWVWVAYLGVLAAFDLAVLVLMRSAFRGLAPIDGRFSTPATLSTVALIGAVIALAGAGILLAAVYQAVSCAGAGQPLTSGCIPRGVFFGGIVLILAGALAAVIGFIGILIGVWRLGDRHGESLFKVAAILLIFPFVNIVGAILMMAAARSGHQKVGVMPGGPPPAGAT